MNDATDRQCNTLAAKTFCLLLLLLGNGVRLAAQEQSEPRHSVASESAAQELRRAITNEVYHMRYGPLRFQASARVGATYTDNVFLSGVNRRNDFILSPEVNLAAILPVGEFNALRLSLGLSYEWFARNSSLNSDAPLVNPDSELVFHLFTGDFHIKLHDKFSYQQTLTFNEEAGDQGHVFNFNDVGRFDRLNNFVGPAVDWDLNMLVLSAAYDHENFISTTEQFKYLDRSSEWFNASANFLIADKSKAGVEAKFSLHDYDHETTLNDHWRARGGPFADVKLVEGLTLRVGGGYDVGRFDAGAGDNSDYDTWYAYGRIRQETRVFTHSLGAGRETVLGDNANNIRTTYVRYSIAAQPIRYVDAEGTLSANFAREFGGGFREYFIQYLAGFRLGYQFHKYWRADVAYEIFVKDSETALRDFHRNRVTLDVSCRF